ncbi:MAG: undecaprenyl-diphosphate phosphatase [Gammaproteobacteria bacterium]
MAIDPLQASVLAIVQGLTEFLPISSSGHLLIPAHLFGWPDQGLAFDVAVHVGTLLAVIIYLRRDLWAIGTDCLRCLAGAESTEQSRLGWMLLLATLPAGFAGLLFNDLVADYARSVLVVAVSTIGFGLLLGWADFRGTRQLGINTLNWRQALFIGLAQVLALIPGTSRSGITMTAALWCNLSRAAAARFSFLLAVPIILASGLLQGLDLVREGVSSQDWLVLLYGTTLAALVAGLCIHFFLMLVETIGFLPFVIYRLLLGTILLWLIWV